MTIPNSQSAHDDLVNFAATYAQTTLSAALKLAEEQLGTPEQVQVMHKLVEQILTRRIFEGSETTVICAVAALYMVPQLAGIDVLDLPKLLSGKMDYMGGYRDTVVGNIVTAIDKLQRIQGETNKAYFGRVNAANMILILLLGVLNKADELLNSIDHMDIPTELTTIDDSEELVNALASYDSQVFTLKVLADDMKGINFTAAGEIKAAGNVCSEAIDTKRRKLAKVMITNP